MILLCVFLGSKRSSQSAQPKSGSFVHQNRFAELSAVLPQGVFVPRVLAKNPGPHHRRRRRVRSECSDPGHLTLDEPFVVPARPSRRLLLVPESVDATPQSVQDREWDTRLDSAGLTQWESGTQFSMLDRSDTLFHVRGISPCAWVHSAGQHRSSIGRGS